MNTLCFYSPYCHRFVSKLLSVAPTIHKTTAANGSKTQGFNIYWIWTNVLHAAHWSCSVMGKCRVLVSTQRHTVQSGSAGSAGSAGTRRQNEAAKRREGGKLLRGIFDPLALTKHHKYPSELATQQHAWGLYLLKLSDTHTPPKNGTPWQERHLFLNLVLLFLWKRKAPTYTHPLISDSLLEGLKHLKRRQWDDRGGNKMGGGDIKADLQGLFQHQSATSFFLSHYSRHKHAHVHTWSISPCHKHTLWCIFPQMYK